MSKADEFDKWFKSTYPEYCCGESVIEPYYSIASYAWECAEQALEVELKSELTKKADTNHSLVEQMADLESKNAELEETVAILRDSASRMRKDLEYKVSVIEQRNKKIEKLEKENARLKADKPQWHDLQKDPNDLPEEGTEVLNDDGVKVIRINGHWRYVYGGEWEDDAHLDHWCEIPTFEKK